MTKRKTKKCRNCGEEFEPFQTTQKVCGFECAVEIGRKDGQRKRDKAHRRRKKEFYANDRAFQLGLAQKAFNAFIRERDKNEPCISCGRHHQGQYHAGHYRTVGAAPHLRFNQFNCHKQCAPCNNHKSGNIVEYRINLVNKIGQKCLDSVECNNVPKLFTIDEIIAIKNYYLKLTRRLQNA